MLGAGQFLQATDGRRPNQRLQLTGDARDADVYCWLSAVPRGRPATEPFFVMRQALPFILCFIAVGAGCRAKQDVDPDGMVGRVLAEVVRDHRLDDYDSQPEVNLPPDGPEHTTYFLDNGNLELWYTGDPPAVTSAIYSPSDKSASERREQRNVQFQKWIESRTSK